MAILDSLWLLLYCQQLQDFQCLVHHGAMHFYCCNRKQLLRRRLMCECARLCYEGMTRQIHKTFPCWIEHLLKKAFNQKLGQLCFFCLVKAVGEACHSDAQKRQHALHVNFQRGMTIIILYRKHKAAYRHSESRQLLL